MSPNEIDITARRKAAEIYRHFAAGRITNDQMEDSQPCSSERGLHNIFFCGIWPLYDDLHEHKLTGRYRLTPESRSHVARIILFLHSKTPYRWPKSAGFRGIGCCLIAVITLGIFRPMRRSVSESGGDESVWPFFTLAEYELALRHPPFLHGKKDV